VRDPIRIDRIVSRLSELWKKYPDLRLCQLIINLVGSDTYYVEDDVLEKAINKYIEE
jgi:uncharacterized protein YihD (DUF1040 family)